MLWLHSLPLAAVDDAYLGELQARATDARLAEDVGWQRLLHRVPGVFGGLESTVDFPGFFLSPEGKTDARTELASTLAAFFDPEPLYDEPSQCRFRARYEWLKARLEFDPARLPPAACNRFDEWAEALNVGALTLVFASNDPDSPSSMFGHTLLRLDARGAAGDQRLLGYAVNYAAQTTRDAGFLYAAKGLTGFYQGNFSVMPYYEKVTEYERFEHRDLWEYPLQLDEPARQRLLWHLWEMRGVHSDYYFFGENCSYQLLSLIEAARPELDLTASFRSGPDYTIPVGSVRKLRDAGVLGEPVFRPASAHRLRHRYDQLDAESRAWALGYIDGSRELDDPVLAAAEPSQRARMLEVAHDALYFRFQKGAATRDAALPRARRLLSARAGLDASPSFSQVPQPLTAPDRGHGSGRIGVGTRLSNNSHAAGLLHWRPAYHDRLDPPQGYLAGGEIEFLGVDAAFDDDGLRLDHVEFLNVQAVGLRDDLFRPWSWFATLAAPRARPLAEDPGAPGGSFAGGGGLATAPFAGAQAFGFVTMRAEANGELDQGYDVGAGARLGLSVQRFAPLTFELTGEWLGGLLGAETDRATLDANAQWSFGVSQGVRLTWRLDDRDGGHTRDDAVELRWLHYF